MKSILLAIFFVVLLSSCSVSVESGTVVDKRYQIVLEDSEGNDETHYVTKQEFESVSVGDSYEIKE